LSFQSGKLAANRFDGLKKLHLDRDKAKETSCRLEEFYPMLRFCSPLHPLSLPQMRRIAVPETAPSGAFSQQMTDSQTKGIANLWEYPAPPDLLPELFGGDRDHQRSATA
jgi:hypothetical protein